MILLVSIANSIYGIVILDSINPGHLQEQMNRMKDLMAHDMNKDKRFR